MAKANRNYHSSGRDPRFPPAWWAFAGLFVMVVIAGLVSCNIAYAGEVRVIDGGSLKGKTTHHFDCGANVGGAKKQAVCAGGVGTHKTAFFKGADGWCKSMARMIKQKGAKVPWHLYRSGCTVTIENVDGQRYALVGYNGQRSKAHEYRHVRQYIREGRVKQDFSLLNIGPAAFLLLILL